MKQANPDPRYWAHKRVLVTGGTGFLGWHLVQQLRPIAQHVRILGLPPKSTALHAALQSCDCVFGDVRDAEIVHRAARDCDIVFHAAGNVAVWGPGLSVMRDIHLTGTQRVIDALPSGARLVHTSSVVAVGASPAMSPRLAGGEFNEDARFNLDDVPIDYVHAKKAAEEIALQAARHGLDVVVVNPGYLIGPVDYEGSVMGRFSLRCWRRKVRLIPPGGMSFADVRDVARGHLLAAERGVSGRRYILAGENVTMVDFVRRLAELRGLDSRFWLPMPDWLHSLIARGAVLHAHWSCKEPFPSRQHVWLSRFHWHYSSQRGRAELGYSTRPLAKTLADMHEWCIAEGLLKPVAAEPRRRAA